MVYQVAGSRHEELFLSKCGECLVIMLHWKKVLIRIQCFVSLTKSL